MDGAVGLDFGTTNSAIAVATPGSEPRLARFETGGEALPTSRSLLYFRPDERDPSFAPSVLTGPSAIEAYLQSEGEHEGRLVQSTKSYLASRHFAPTDIFGTEFELEDLIGFIVAELRAAAEAQFGELPGTVVAGRPVRFVNSRSDTDEAVALGRLESALRRGGFEQVLFELEPVAAAYQYARRLRRPEVVVIADFGGGTSDFSVMRMAPDGHGEVLGSDGVGKAGDDFDARLVRNRAAAHFGRGGQYKNEFGTQVPVPRWVFGHLERWHHLSFLKAPRRMSVLLDLKNAAVDPTGIEAFLRLVERDRAYSLHRSVERAKHALSDEDEAQIRFSDPPLELCAPLTRAEFETWIAPELSEIARCLDGLLEETGVDPGAVDAVFLTGGSSRVPSVRHLFVERFGAERLRGGEELTSVASGLALRGLHRAEAPGGGGLG